MLSDKICPFTVKSVTDRRNCNTYFWSPYNIKQCQIQYLGDCCYDTANMSTQGEVRVDNHFPQAIQNDDDVIQ